MKQLVDVPGHEYFSYLGEKTQQEAARRAKVDVCGAGWPHVPERCQGGRREQGALCAAARRVAQGEGQGEGWDWQAKVAEVEAAKAVAIREAELQMEVQESNTLFYSWQKAADTTLYKEMKAAVR
ncbi:unnamed protein product [Triticum turgidum subsp. durum]|uniref:Flotillin-like n=1 Tax=Triticum turgidum subsp. durum TaxID=4567 RepID=A0A9R1S536_TRITD|nr:unnamed protein product [Triticum turgidum subsp. durum]